MPASSPSVLIIRLDAIGDALALTPLLAALRAKAIPVDIVLRPINAHVFSRRAARTIYQEPFELRSDTHDNLAAIAAFGAELRKNEYTHVLVATEDPGGYRLAHAIGAPERIGFVNGWGKPFKTVWARSLLTRVFYRSAGLDPKAPHECEVLFKLGRPLLGESAVPTRDPKQLRPLVIEHEPASDPRIAFQVTDKWHRLGIALDDVIACYEATRRAGEVRLISSIAENAYAREFAERTGVTIETFDDIERWKEAIAGARALVAPDSGALHVAGATATPTVAVFPSENFRLQAARWSPWASPYQIIEVTAGWYERTLPALRELLQTTDDPQRQAPAR